MKNVALCLRKTQMGERKCQKFVIHYQIDCPPQTVEIEQSTILTLVVCHHGGAPILPNSHPKNCSLALAVLDANYSLSQFRGEN